MDHPFVKINHPYGMLVKKEQIMQLKEKIWANNGFTSKNDSGSTATSPGAIPLSKNDTKINEEKLGWRYLGYSKDGNENYLDLGHFSNTMYWSSKPLMADNLVLLGGDLVEYYQALVSLNPFGGLTSNKTSAGTGEDLDSNRMGVEFKNEFLSSSSSDISATLNAYLKSIGAVNANQAENFTQYKAPGYATIPQSQTQLDDDYRARGYFQNNKLMAQNFAKSPILFNTIQHAFLTPLEYSSKLINFAIITPIKATVNAIGSLSSKKEDK